MKKNDCVQRNVRSNFSICFTVSLFCLPLVSVDIQVTAEERERLDQIAPFGVIRVAVTAMILQCVASTKNLALGRRVHHNSCKDL